VTKLLIDIPEISDGAASCAGCPFVEAGDCIQFGEDVSIYDPKDHHIAGFKRCPACLAAEQKAKGASHD